MNNVMKMISTYTCTGCCRCIQFCPNGYISLKQGDLGFLVPYIVSCDNCGECIKNCPFSDEFNDAKDE